MGFLKSSVFLHGLKGAWFFEKDQNYTLVCVSLCDRGVIKHHNGVSLPSVKEKTEKKRRGEMKVSSTSMWGTEEGGGWRGGEKINKASFGALHWACFCQLCCTACVLGFRSSEQHFLLKKRGLRVYMNCIDHSTTWLFEPQLFLFYFKVSKVFLSL